jgi:DHA1 family bicyclomycin/chloramphenicol resistance-like MFS transporter
MTDRSGQRMATGEFVALVAMMFSTVAFSIDALLPAMPAISMELGAEGRVHLLITLFVAGLALGTLVAGPMSDAMGRKPVMYLGAALYIGAGLAAWLSGRFDVIVVARLVQGIGAAGPRVVSLAVVRDLYEGRQMARIVSLAMVLFTIVPTIAPALGALLADVFGWRAILLSFVLFSVITTLWVWLRLDEPLAAANRRPFHVPRLWHAAGEVFRHRIVRLAILAQGVALGLIISLIAHVQQIYDQSFGMADSFPYWFGGIALFSAASTSLANAYLVVRFGMRRMVTFGMTGQVASAAIVLFVILAAPHWAFPAFAVWQFMLIWLSGLCVGNLNAIALEPMGHIAGLTASLTGAVSTLLAALASAVIGPLYDGTPIPLIFSALCLSLAGVLLVWRLNMHARILSTA